MINLESGPDTVPIDSFGTIIFSTKEKIKLGKYTNIVGHFGLRIQYGLKGFILQVGPQIEPGYDGPLFGALLNTRNKKQFIPRDTRFLTVEFYRSETPASTGLSGKFKPKTINSLRNFLMAQGIEDDALVEQSIVKQTEKDFDECQRKHNIKSARQEREEDRRLVKMGIFWKIMAIIIATLLALIIFFLNKYIPSRNRQEAALPVRAAIEPNRPGQEQKKDSDPPIEGDMNEPVLIDKAVPESNRLRIEQINASDPNFKSIRKDHNEP